LKDGYIVTTNIRTTWAKFGCYISIFLLQAGSCHQFVHIIKRVLVIELVPVIGFSPAIKHVLAIKSGT
jgi:hypothetical protein